MADARSDSRTNAENTTGASASRQRSTAYPRYTLAQAEGFAKAIFDLAPRGSDQDRVAQRAGYSRTSGSYKSLRATAHYFGLVETTSKGDLAVTDEWIDVFHSEDPNLLKRARQEALYRPPLYRQLLEEYAGRHIPLADKLARELHIKEKYRILPDAAGSAAKTFLESASYAGVIDDDGRVKPLDPQGAPGNNPQHGKMPMQVLSRGNTPSGQQTGQDPTGNYSTTQGQSNPGSNESSDGSVQTVAIPAGLDRFEVNLRGGKKAFLFVPPTITEKDKSKLIGVINLLDVEEDLMPVQQSLGAVQNSLQTAQPPVDDDLQDDWEHGVQEQ